MRRIFILAAWLGVVATVHARPFTVVAYNVENLMDVDGVTEFEEYQPARYSRGHALTKLQNVARLLAQFENGRGPDVIIFNELEVDFTPAARPHDYDVLLRRYAGTTLAEMLGAKFDAAIGDLPAEALLAKALEERGLTGYRVVPAESVVTEGRARLAQKCVIFTRIAVRRAQSHPTVDARAILEAELEVDGAVLHVFANHWKSGASDAELEKTRVANAQTLRRRLDEIFRGDPQADVIIGGDFNSQYNQKLRHPEMAQTALNDVLGSQGNEQALPAGERALYNLWYELPPAERGSDTYRGEWGTLMHLIIARGLYDQHGVQYVDNSFRVAKFPNLNADDKGLPVRWSFDGPAGSGFSDHFPVYARFVTVPDKRKDRWITLANPGVENAGTPPPFKIDYAAMDLPQIALTRAKLPAGADLRSETYKGKIFRVEGRVGPGARLVVDFMGATYDVWSYDVPLRTRLREEYQEGETIRFYGELGQYRDRWQFIVQDPSWVK